MSAFRSVVRVAAFLLCLTLCVFLSSSLSLKPKSWIFTGGLAKVVDCPRDWFYSGRFVDGNSCSITAIENSRLQMARVCSSNDDETVTCRFNEPCNRVCLTERGKSCPTELNRSSVDLCTIDVGKQSIVDVPCRNLKVEAFCDSEQGITVGQVFVIRSVFLGSVVVTVLWLLTDLLLRKAARRAESSRDEDMILQGNILPILRTSYRSLVDSLWYQEAKTRRQYSETIRTFNSALQNSISPLQSRDPRKRFQASAWLRRLEMYRELRSRKDFEFQSRGFFRSIFLNILFMGVLVASITAVILLFPKQLAGRDVAAKEFSFWTGLTWFDFLILVDVCFEFTLMTCACVCRSWPKTRSTLPAQDFESVVEGKSPRSAISADDGSIDTMSDDFFASRKLADVCLMIACHESCSNKIKEAQFRETLEAALAIFPADQVFVCDNGNSLSPLDGTWDLVRSVDQRINYVYIPEGNKTVAFYWVSRYWIPLLAEHNKSKEFSYAMLIDDDVVLPPDLVIPEDYIAVHPEIKAVHFPLTALPADSLVSEFQDLEYKMAASHKYLQSGIGRVLSCHGAISLWSRKSLNEVLLEHDTVFHGEDLYAGLILLRMRDNSRIVSLPSVPVFTRAPDNWLDLFRQRVKSWDVTSHKKTFSFLVELISPVSFFHAYSLALKPYFLLEILCIVLDWLRVFVLVALVLKSPVSLGVSLAVFFAVLYFQLLLHQVVFLRNQPGLRSSIVSVLLFPLYKMVLSVFRVAALCQNVVVYSHDRKSLKISTREDEVHDIPPLPPHVLVDWFTVWTASLPPKATDRSQATTRSTSSL